MLVAISGRESVQGVLMRFLATMAVVGCLAVSGPAYGERWSPPFPELDGQVFVDFDTIAGSERAKSIVVKHVFNEPEAGVKTVLKRVEFACHEKTATTTSYEAFDINGNKVKSATRPEADKRKRTPEAFTFEGTLYQNLCDPDLEDYEH